MPRALGTPALALALVALPRARRLRVQRPGRQAAAARSTSSPPRPSAAWRRCTAPSGTLTFRVKNTGADTTEFYLLGEDRLRIVGEVENVGPGLTRDLVVQARPGHVLHVVQAGHGGRRDRGRVHGHGLGRVARARRATSRRSCRTPRTAYIAYVKDQAGALISATEAFADAYAAGDDATARDLYATGPRPLGAHRARRGVVRRPRSPARRPRGGRAGGRGMDRLAPHREGPLAARGRRERRHRLRPPHARRARGGRCRTS